MSLNELGEKSRATIILGKFCKQAIIKLSLAYSFRKMFFIGQNLKHVHMTYSFLELLIFFWLTLVDIWCLEFFSPCQKNIVCEWIQTSWETNYEIKANIFTCFWYWCWKNCFLNVKLNLFIIFISTFSEAVVYRCSSK